MWACSLSLGDWGRGVWFRSPGPGKGLHLHHGRYKICLGFKSINSVRFPAGCTCRLQSERSHLKELGDIFDDGPRSLSASRGW